MGRPALARVRRACPTCGKEREWRGSLFTTYPSRKGNLGFCSRKCAAQSRLNRDLFRCEKCGRLAPRRRGNHLRKRFCSHDCEIASRESPGFLDKHGYRILRIRGREVPEHRIVMEGMIGRPLLAAETVHHKNGMRADNRPDNLELWDSRNPKGQRVADKIAWCVWYLMEHGYAVTPWNTG